MLTKENIRLLVNCVGVSENESQISDKDAEALRNELRDIKDTEYGTCEGCMFDDNNDPICNSCLRYPESDVTDHYEKG